MSESLNRPEDWFMYYLANPYTHDDEKVRSYRYEASVKAAKALISLGYCVFVPIAYNGTWEIDYTWKFWERIDLPILDRCSGLILLEIPGWDKSTGVKGELEHCHTHGIPIISISYEDLDNESVLRRKMEIFQSQILRNRRTIAPKFSPDVLPTPKCCGGDCSGCPERTTSDPKLNC